MHGSMNVKQYFISVAKTPFSHARLWIRRFRRTILPSPLMIQRPWDRKVDSSLWVL